MSTPEIIDGNREGDRCSDLNKIIKVLIISNPNYLVFLDEEYYVEWVEFGPCKYPSNYSQVMNKVSYLETISATHFAGTPKENNDFSEFRRLLGEAVARLYDEDGEAAEFILDQAEQLLRDRSVERARLWYLTAAGISSIPACVALVICWSFRDFFRQFLGGNAFEVGICACLGALGSLIFIIIRVRQVNLNASSGPTVHYLEGIARVTVGYVGGFLIALAVKANILLGEINQLNNPSVGFATIMCLSMIAGASERIVPNLIRRIESSSDHHPGKAAHK